MSELNLGVICESEGAIDGPDVLQEANTEDVVQDDAVPNPPVDGNIQSLQSLVDKYIMYFGDIEFD